jgi:hypothetical protein
VPSIDAPRAIRLKTTTGWADLVIQGPPGPPGDAAGYVYNQASPSSTWVIVHNLARYPAITVVDTGGSVVIPSVVYDSTMQITVTFGSPTSGKAYLT